MVAFVDGSYNSAEKKSGFGTIIIDDKGIQTPLYKAFTKQHSADFLELGNVAAELEGVKEAIKWAEGLWQAKKEITRQYVSFLKEKRKSIQIEFIKVSAHQMEKVYYR